MSQAQIVFDGNSLLALGKATGADLGNKIVKGVTQDTTEQTRLQGRSSLQGYRCATVTPSTTSYNNGENLADNNLGMVASWQSSNIAVGGQTTQAMLSDEAAELYPLIKPFSGRTVVAVWEGSNDLAFGATPTAAYNHLVEYATNAKQQGAAVVILTITPRGAVFENGVTAAQFEQGRQQINTWLRQNWSNYADALADVAAIPTIGFDGAETNTQYYLDQLHFTEQGNQVIADFVSKIIEQVAASPQPKPQSVMQPPPSASQAAKPAKSHKASNTNHDRPVVDTTSVQAINQTLSTNSVNIRGLTHIGGI